MDKEDVLIILMIITLVGAIVCGSLTLANSIAEHSCNAMTKNIGFPHRYGFWEGCMIEVTPGKWLPLDNYYWEDK